MGDMADMLIEQMIDAEIFELENIAIAKEAAKTIRLDYDKQTIKWTTKDKRKIPVKDMSSTHLLNTYRMIRRQMESNVERAESHCIIATAWLDVLYLEIEKRKLTVLI